MEQALVLDSKLQTEKTIAWWLYVGHGLSFLLTLTTFSWIPLIINFVKRPDTEGTFVRSHHSWQIRSFIWFWLWMALAGILWFTVVGIPVAMLIMGVAWLWKAYRLIKGILDLGKNQAMPV
ncbi:MAG: hypothetical protein V4695_09500 [Pseudomonadota bacterium]